MYPLIGGVPTYLAAWAVATVVCLPIGVFLAVQAGIPRWKAVVVLLGFVLLLILGSKALYVLEMWLYPAEDYVPVPLRGWSHGFRIPGGIVLLGLGLPVICRAVGLRWRAFGDATISVVALALVIVRFGCFLNGCCFGRVTDLPWGVRFPMNTWPHHFHRAQGLLEANAQVSLPVHPLQLYFAGSALLALVLCLSTRRDAPPGFRQLEFYLVFFATSALIEPLRANPLTLNTIVLLVGSLITAGLLLQMSSAGKRVSAHAT